MKSVTELTPDTGVTKGQSSWVKSANPDGGAVKVQPVGVDTGFRASKIES